VLPARHLNITEPRCLISKRFATRRNNPMGRDAGNLGIGRGQPGQFNPDGAATIDGRLTADASA
jgi:hypothetical protein